MTIENTELFYEQPTGRFTPIIIVHTFEKESANLWEELKALECQNFILAAVSVENWESDLSPWKAKKVFKGGSDFGSGADKQIAVLTDTILPQIRQQTGSSEGSCYLAGYSFAGLFALYSLYRTTVFSGSASVSGSLWFPGFIDFSMKHEFPRKPDALYFSLGDKESSTRNEIMKTVGENTEQLFSHYNKLNINCTYETNPGNHFQEPEKRLAKGIAWLLKESKADCFR